MRLARNLKAQTAVEGNVSRKGSLEVAKRVGSVSEIKHRFEQASPNALSLQACVDADTAQVPERFFRMQSVHRVESLE